MWLVDGKIKGEFWISSLVPIKYSHLSVPTEPSPPTLTPEDAKIHAYSNSFYKMIWYLHVICEHPTIYYKLSPDYLSRMGTIKDRNSKDPTEVEEIKKRVTIHRRTIQKSLNNPYNHNGVVTNLKPDIPECEVKWVLRKHYYEQNYWRW